MTVGNDGDRGWADSVRCPAQVDGLRMGRRRTVWDVSHGMMAVGLMGGMGGVSRSKPMTGVILRKVCLMPMRSVSEARVRHRRGKLSDYYWATHDQLSAEIRKDAMMLMRQGSKWNR